MKNNLLISIFFCISIIPLSASDNRISLSDFTIHSDNIRYKYMGKGISEMISVELQKSPEIILIEREQRTEILEEMKIFLSGLGDNESNIDIGKMLIAGYIIFGEIIDMDKNVIISLRMVDVESRKIIWNDKLTEKLSRYDYISGYFASSILDFLNIEISKTTVVKVEEKKEKNEELVIAFSNAVDHYDKNEIDQAKIELTAAKKIDPKNEATDYYLSKLITNTTKFKVMTEQYISYQNPAYLGILRTDRFHLGGSKALTEDINAEPFLGTPIPGGELTEEDQRVSAGYYFPVGENPGFGIEYIFFEYEDRTWLYVPDPESPSASNRVADGGIFSFGYNLTPSISVGLSLSTYYRVRKRYDQNLYPPEDYYTKPDSDWCFGFSPGFLYRNRDESFIFDTRIAYSNEKIVPINGDYTDNVDFSDDYILEDEVNLPFFWENTFTFAFNDRKTFFVLKQLND